MELSTFNIVDKLGSNEYSLWTGRWPRAKIHEIRQTPHIIEGAMARVFAEITSLNSYNKSLCNIILPDCHPAPTPDWSFTITPITIVCMKNPTSPIRWITFLNKEGNHAGISDTGTGETYS